MVCIPDESMNRREAARALVDARAELRRFVKCSSSNRSI